MTILLMATLIAIKLLAGDVHINARLTDSLLKILRFELAMFIIAVGFLNGDSHDIEDISRLLEDGVHLLQGTVSSLREEEVNAWEHESVSVGC